MATFVEGRAIGFGIGSEARDKSIPWYKKDLGEIPSPACELLEKYAGIAPDKVVHHIYEMVS